MQTLGVVKFSWIWGMPSWVEFKLSSVIFKLSYAKSKLSQAEFKIHLNKTLHSFYQRQVSYRHLQILYDP